MILGKLQRKNIGMPMRCVHNEVRTMLIHSDKDGRTEVLQTTDKILSLTRRNIEI